MSFNYFKDLLGGSVSYLSGKQGKLPNWQIKGKGFSEIFSKEGYKAGGEWYRKAATSRIKSFGTGLFGLGAMEYAEGKEGMFPDWGRPGQFPKVFDKSGEGKGLVNIEIPPFPELPKIPEIGFPEIQIPDLTGLIPSFPEIQIPVDIGGLPSMSLMDEEGQPNIMLLGGLALGAYLILKGGKK